MPLVSLLTPPAAAESTPLPPPQTPALISFPPTFGLGTGTSWTCVAIRVGGVWRDGAHWDRFGGGKSGQAAEDERSVHDRP